MTIPRAVIFAIGLLSALASGAPALTPEDREAIAVFEGRTITRIDLVGNSVTKEWVINRELYFTQIGDPLDLTLVRKDVVRLENLSVFSSIGVRGEEDGDDGVALQITVREMPWIIPYLKFKYTEENGWSVGPTVSSLNLTGRAIRLTGYVLFGGTTTGVVEMYYPWILGRPSWMDLRAAVLDRNDTLNEFQEDSIEITPEIGIYVGRRAQVTAIASYFRMSSDVDGKTLNPRNRDDLYRFGLGAGFDSRNSWRNPTRGWQLGYEIIKTGGFLGGDGDWWLSNLDVRRYQPSFGNQSFVVHGLYSHQSGVAEVDVPGYLLYRLGGANTVRGYDIDVLGREVVGKNQLLLTAEYYFPVIPLREYELWKWAASLGLQVALFGDVGHAWNEPEALQAKRFVAGYGAGLRFLVPGINQVRVDFGTSRERKVRFHFGVWPKADAQRLRLR